MQRIVACRIASYGAFQHRAWDHLPTLGVRHVEAPVPPRGEAGELRERLRRHGLEAASLQGKVELASPDAVSQADVCFEACAALDVPRLFLSVKRGGMDPETAYDRLRRLGDAAAHHGVTVVLETHPDLLTNGDLARQTMQAVDHPHVRLNFDTANVYYYNRGVTARGELAKCIDYVAAVHLKDTGGGYRAWDFPALGAGVVDFPAVVAMLDARGFSGPYTMELEGQEGVEYTEASRLAMVSESVAHLRRIGLM